MPIEIREYEKGDMTRLAFAADDEWNRYVTRLVLSLRGYDGRIEKCYVAEEGGRIAGFIHGYALRNGLLIVEFVYVTPDRRGSGIGSRLLEHMERESGCTAAMVYYNRSLHDYYEKRGYSAGGNLETAIKELKRG